jgi:hypothetical protein
MPRPSCAACCNPIELARDPQSYRAAVLQILCGILENTFSGAALTTPTLSSSGITSSSANLTATAPTGGVSPYSFQWYRSTTNGFTPGESNTIPGVSSLTFTDSGLLPSTTYYYRLITSDLTNTSVTSAQLTVTTTA